MSSVTSYANRILSAGNNVAKLDFAIAEAKASMSPSAFRDMINLVMMDERSNWAADILTDC